MHTENATLIIKSREDSIADLQESYQFLNNSRRIFAHPFSLYNDRAKDILKETGVSMAFIIKSSKVNANTDKYLIPRYSITPDLNLEDFAYIVRE